LVSRHLHAALVSRHLHAALVINMRRIQSAFILLSGALVAALAGGASYRPF
jgi:hypothetical protein